MPIIRSKIHKYKNINKKLKKNDEFILHHDNKQSKQPDYDTDYNSIDNTNDHNSKIDKVNDNPNIFNDQTLTRNSTFIPYNNLPMTGPQMISNVIKCKYYEKGKCLYGDRCKYSHIFKDKIELNTNPSNKHNMQINIALINDNPSKENLSYNKSFRDNDTIHIIENKLPILITPRIKSINDNSIKRIAYNINNTETSQGIIAILINGNQSNIFIYDYKYFNLRKKIHLPIITDFTLVRINNNHRFSAYNDNPHNNNNQENINQVHGYTILCIFDHTCGYIKLYDHLMNKIIRKIYIGTKYTMHSNLISYNMIMNSCQNHHNGHQNSHHHDAHNDNICYQGDSINKIKGIPMTYYIIIFDDSGFFYIYNLFRGKLIKAIIVGHSFTDFIFMPFTFIEDKEFNYIDSRYKKSKKHQDIDPKNFYVCLPKSVILASKGIHIWDIYKNKKIRTLTYNQYAKYIKCIDFEYKEYKNNGYNTQNLIIALGHLHDQIIEFSYDMFIEIWNPNTGGCVKRINNTNIQMNFPNDCFQFKFFHIQSINKDCILIVTPNIIQIWDIYDQEKILWSLKGLYESKTFNLRKIIQGRQIELNLLSKEPEKSILRYLLT